MKRITFTLPDIMETKLQKLKELTGLTASDLVRRGLEKLIKEHGL